MHVCVDVCCLQGFSTGLPERLQLALLRTLPGLESCAMLRPAYAVEYDYLPAHQCHASLETKKFKGLFFSGQLNGTTGEALSGSSMAGSAAQGIQHTFGRPGSTFDSTLTADLSDRFFCEHSTWLQTSTVLPMSCSFFLLRRL
jgi:tRNA uridine 5-carboxymethylaminomethyl modification enzyme